MINFCDELKYGIPLIENGRTNMLPYGISRDAKIEEGCLSTRIQVLKGLQLGGQHSLTDISQNGLEPNNHQ